MRYHLCLLGCLASMLVGPGLAQDGDEPVETETLAADQAPPVAEDACFMTREIRGFDAISDQFILVEGRRDEYFLLTMFAGCFGLDNAFGISIRSNLSRVCSNSAAKIAYRGPGGRRETCSIRGVESVDSKEAAEQIVAQRTQ